MFLLQALARPIASSLSASSANNSASFDPITVTGECIDINGCRTTTGILWSCLSVIFICTWVAIHPNIPRAQDDEGTPWHPAVVIYQNVQLMLVALLAPEFMILWAMRQRRQAKRIRDRFKKGVCQLRNLITSASVNVFPLDYGWGMSHGFFVIMGGFALYNGKKFCGYLWDRDRTAEIEEAINRPFEGESESYFDEIKAYNGKVETLNESDEKTLDSSTKSESHDNSSTTNPTETHLLSPSEPTTILEFLIAKGYITLTEDYIKDNLSHSDVITKSIAVIQTTWFILQVIARAVEGLAITELEIITVGFAILNFGTYFLWWNKPLRVRHPIRVYWRHTEKSVGGDPNGEKGGIWRTCSEGGGAVVDYIYVIPLLFIIERPSNIFFRLFLLPLWILWHIFLICGHVVGDTDNGNFAIPISSRLEDNASHLYITVYGIAALFGAIHCIPWVFPFPTHTEQLLWRISAMAVAVAPIAMGVLHGYMENLWDESSVLLNATVVVLVIVLSLAYAVFRITLIVIAFTALRDLPSSAYQTVKWTTFIPHIG
ncbi:hypothetical protein VNI00_018103 [Paramarasmius palmivorus]|uniref:Uncharacterized protein n=1 Tax=Paramarasmius palmivorus TaxID=297713 RepID=A0AAW0B1I3_9AGAR